VHYRKTQYGFEWGNAKIKRYFDDEKRGWVTLGIETDKHPNGIQICITKTGKVRIHSNGGEWVPPNKATPAD